MIQHLCRQCGRTFECSPSVLGVYCSLTCRDAARHEARHSAPCEVCGVTVYRAKTRRKKHLFCSRTCFRTWKARNQVCVQCKQCGKEFLVCQSVSFQKGAPRLYCSAKCFGLAKRRGSSGALASNPRSHEINMWRQSVGWKAFRSAWLASHPICAECGKTRRGRNLVVHHIVNPDPTRDEALLFSPSNLRVLCRSCHIKIHHS